MEACLNYLFCREPLAKEIAKHAAVTIIPQVILCGGLAGVWHIPPSEFDGGAFVKFSIIGAIAFLIAGHIFALIYYYRKVFQKCFRRQVSFIELQPSRMQPQDRPQERGAVFNEVDYEPLFLQIERRPYIEEDGYVRFLPNRDVVYMP